MYQNASARVRVGTSFSDRFEVKVGVHLRVGCVVKKPSPWNIELATLRVESVV